MEPASTRTAPHPGPAEDTAPAEGAGYRLPGLSRDHPPVTPRLTRTTAPRPGRACFANARIDQEASQQHEQQLAA